MPLMGGDYTFNLTTGVTGDLQADPQSNLFQFMIINRAFINEILRTALAVTLVIVAIFLVTRVMGFLNQAAEGIIPVSGVFSLVGLKMIAYLDVMLPLMFYIALIMVLNRWHNDHEMAVLASAGIGMAHWLKPLSILIIAVGGLVAFFSFYLTPLSIGKGFALERQYRDSNEVSGVITGKFVEAKDANGVYFVEDYNRRTGNYENVFVYRASFEREGVVVAQTAYRTEDEKTQDQFLVLMNGTRYEGNPGTPDYRVVDFEKYAVRIEPRNQTKLYLPIRARSNKELRESEVPAHRAEWYWRLAKVFTLPILALFALALSHVDARRGKSTGMVLAFMVYLTYTNLLGYTVALVKKGEATSGSPIWLVHLTYLILAVYCLYRRNYNLPLIPQLSLPKVQRSWRSAG
ncbi:MAG: LPS export ABC transporter permease LptF [Gammaproteobacteria bacterium]|nr:LPS export ABC transporter permease LptF [Gammaproteobacteria bacterium]